MARTSLQLHWENCRANTFAMSLRKDVPVAIPLMVANINARHLDPVRRLKEPPASKNGKSSDPSCEVYRVNSNTARGIGRTHTSGR